jgi:hypothetical protein
VKSSVFAVDEEPVALRIQWEFPARRKSELIDVPELDSPLARQLSPSLFLEIYFWGALQFSGFKNLWVPW